MLVTIHGIGSSGEGVGRVDDFTVFVPFALPGETVRVAINMVKKTYATWAPLRNCYDGSQSYRCKFVIFMDSVEAANYNTLPMKGSFH